MAKKKVETWLDEELIEFLKTCDYNRSKAIRDCLIELKEIKEEKKEK